MTKYEEEKKTCERRDGRPATTAAAVAVAAVAVAAVAAVALATVLVAVAVDFWSGREDDAADKQQQ